MAQGEPAAARLLRILDEAEIRAVLVNFVGASDRYDADGVAASFHPDAHYEHGALFEGTVAEFNAWGMDPNRTNAASAMSHPLTNIRIEVDGDAAAAESYCVASFLKRGDEGDARVVWWGGRFLDRLERRNGRWKIAQRRVILDWDVSFPYRPAYPAETFAAGQRSKDDASYELFACVRDGRPWPPPDSGTERGDAA